MRSINILYGIILCRICIWEFHMSIRIWDIPYMYGTIYAYQAEQLCTYVTIVSLTIDHKYVYLSLSKFNSLKLKMTYHFKGIC